MSWFGRPIALLLALSGTLGGCYGSIPCTQEVCDGRDNDCDGAVDERFLDGRGRYVDDAHCGACGVSCDEVFPTARLTECVAPQDGEVPYCEVKACPDGERLSGGAACVKDTPVLCLPCEDDGECDLRSPGARCLADGSGDGRCGRACDANGDCPQGYLCLQPEGAPDPQCIPNNGFCVCADSMIGAEFACQVMLSELSACAGVQRCTADGLGECVPVLAEQCNGVDDDCDLRVDEDFTNPDGRYASAEHCGGCGARCVSPGVNMTATCEVADAQAQCGIECDEGWVDVDGLAATGCECELIGDVGIVIGGDADCDGEIDPTPDLIFVAQTGDDDNEGGDVSAPVRTLAKGLARGLETGRDVLVARGIYEGPVTMIEGVSLIGGYSPDFRERDVELFPVVIETPDGDGAPVLACANIDDPTVVEGLTIVGSDAKQPGTGSTAVYLDGCTSNVVLSSITVLAGRGASGLAGASSSERLVDWGLSSLAQLGGTVGAPGGDGGFANQACPQVPGGEGAAKSCPFNEVSGGTGGAAACPDMPQCDNGTPTPCGNSGCTEFTVGGVCDIDAAKAVAHPNPPALPGLGPGAGAAGDFTYNSPTNRNTCNFCDDNPSLAREGGNGSDGLGGSDGSAGEGCFAAELVNLVTGRVVSTGGTDGLAGTDGSGGGGATAGAGYAKIANTTGTCTSVSGGSGGGGGSGGCGAPGASGGGGAGSSIAVTIRIAPASGQGPDLDGVRVVTSSGGDGGDGGIGAAGGAGGSGGVGGLSQFWCSRNGGRGGDGGQGGDGGGGGGGCAGSSYGLYIVPSGLDATQYAARLEDEVMIERAGIAGRGGRGGFSPGNSAQNGADGRVEDVWLP